MPTKDYLTVEELNFYISHVFSEEELLHNVPVVGEVSGCSVVNGHCYFVLKDAKAQIKVVFYNCLPGNAPKNGEQVLVRGSVDYYSKGGQINVKAYQITPFGRGILYEQLEKLRKKLEEEGLFREEHKKELPLRPRRVAVITSVQGAAVQDFLTTSLKKNTVTDISVIDVRVQGEKCVSDVVTALINADEYGFDVIVLARGGGSFEDLYAFNDEKVVRTIYNMKTPVISAIGHETDYTLCDYVADYRAITPTAAAEKVAFDASLIKNEIIDLAEQIGDLANDILSDEKHRVENQAMTIKNKANFLLQMQYEKINSFTKMMNIYQKHVFDLKSNEIDRILTRLDDLNPTKLLKNGYFRIVKAGKDIYDSKEIKVNDKILIVGEKEKITATVEKKERV
ncbi:MAG: exodeoxyribonuclease VII large subunit [Clostridia bacterium]|nr:exodeoxyribonuclease VII large subunit [Clostridia bacterium]